MTAMGNTNQGKQNAAQAVEAAAAEPTVEQQLDALRRELAERDARDAKDAEAYNEKVRNLEAERDAEKKSKLDTAAQLGEARLRLEEMEQASRLAAGTSDAVAARGFMVGLKDNPTVPVLAPDEHVAIALYKKFFGIIKTPHEFTCTECEFDAHEAKPIHMDLHGQPLRRISDDAEEDETGEVRYAVSTEPFKKVRGYRSFSTALGDTMPGVVKAK
jgi:hypothetical protein